MKPPLNVTLVKAEYVTDYKYRFTFSNKKESVVNYKPMFYHGTMYRKFLDVTRFKNIIIDKNLGIICWGKYGDMSFGIESYYGETVIKPIPIKKIKAYLKKTGLDKRFKLK